MRFNEVTERAKESQQEVQEKVRQAAEWFHEREGEFLPREEARDALSDALSVSEELANRLITSLVQDSVDPVQQVRAVDERYVGIEGYAEIEGAYSYVRWDKKREDRRIYVCARCVKEAKRDDEVFTAEDVRYEEREGHNERLPNDKQGPPLSVVGKHYYQEHEVEPEEVDVVTGAILRGDSTAGGTQIWSAGNDGPGSGLNADLLDGEHAKDINDNIQKVEEKIQTVSGLGLVFSGANAYGTDTS